MTLTGKLDDERARASEIPAVRTAYEATVAELARSRFLDHALRPGAAFPDFVLPDTAGRLVTLADLLGRGPLVVTFFRGNWCPYCALTLAALEEALPAIGAAGATLVAITPETGGRAAEAKQQHAPRCTILVDVDSGVGLQCGVIFRAPEPYRALLATAGIDLPERQGQGGWLLPVPAAYVLDRAGVIRWAFLDVDFTHRAEPAAIVKAIEEIGASPSRTSV